MCDHEYQSWDRKGKPCPYDDRMKYGLVRWDDKEYCIFHAPMEAKKDRTDRLWERFFKLIEELKKPGRKSWDFEGFIFPHTADRFWRYDFPKDIEANFSWAIFSGGANFSEATFSGRPNFFKATFSGGADFSEATFLGVADFSEATFSEGAYFSGATFSGVANFSRATFSGAANFLKATFLEEVDFSRATFSKNAFVSFIKVTFSGAANFLKAQFSGEVNFRWAQFSGWADFERAQFSGTAYYRGAQFSGEANFFEAQFSGPVEFVAADFSGTTIFNQSYFLDIVSFSYANFSESAHFLKVKACSNMDFSSVVFLSQVNFQGSFIAQLDFSGTTFRVKPHFGTLGTSSADVEIRNLVSDAVLEFEQGYKKISFDKKQKKYVQSDKEDSFTLLIEGGEVSGIFTFRSAVNNIKFSDTTFRATVNISPKVTNLKPHLTATRINFLGDVNIENTSLQEIKSCCIASTFRLAYSDLSRAKFSSVDLTRIDFDNVTWTKVLRRRSRILWRWFRKTDGLYDEVELGNKKAKKDKSTKEEMYFAPDLRKTLNDEKDDKKRKKIEDEIKRLEEMYRQVASSYEARRRFGLAGHFKAGEFEVRRQRKETSPLEHFILVCYRWISFYGEEVTKPLLLLLILLPIISAFFFLWVVGGWHPSWEVIRNFNYDGFGVWFADLSQNYTPAITCGFQGLIPTFNYLTDYPGLLSTIIGLVEKLFAALFTSLFLFALRRRVKR